MAPTKAMAAAGGDPAGGDAKARVGNFACEGGAQEHKCLRCQGDADDGEQAGLAQDDADDVERARRPWT